MEVLSSVDSSFIGQQQRRKVSFVINAIKKEPVSIMFNSASLTKKPIDNEYGWSYSLKDQKVYVTALIDIIQENQIIMDVD